MSVPVPPVLKELHRLRRLLRDLQSEIDLGPRVLKARQDKLAAEQKAHQDAHDALKKLKLKQKDDEGTLKQTEQRLAKVQADLNTAGSKKEFDAKNAEIAHAQARKGELEDAIIAAMTEIEERTAALPAVEKQWADAQAEFAQYQRDAKDRLDRLKADVADTQARLTQVEATLPPEVKPLYDRLVKTHGADGLAAVAGRVCQQCRTSVTEQQRTDLAGGTFVCCPRCGRGLYPAE